MEPRQRRARVDRDRCVQYMRVALRGVDVYMDELKCWGYLFMTRTW